VFLDPPLPLFFHSKLLWEGALKKNVKRLFTKNLRDSIAIVREGCGYAFPF